MAKGDRRNRGKGTGRDRGRPRKDGPRDHNDRLIPEAKRAPPPEHIVRRREMFSFITSAEGQIDQDVCDGIGQLHALGMLDGYSIDGLELRNVGREWRNWFVTLLRKQGFKAGGYERMDKAREREPRHSERLDAMDANLSGYERHALYSLLIDPVVGSWPCGEADAPWVRAIIAEGLLKRKRFVQFTRFPDGNDYALLGAAVRGLLDLYGEGMMRRAA